jgi:hypothetical protein
MPVKTFGGRRAAAYKYAAALDRKPGLENVQVQSREGSGGKRTYSVEWNAIRYKNPRRRKAARTKRNCRNPKQLLFRTKAAAVAYAKAHGAKKFSVRKLKRAS